MFNLKLPLQTIVQFTLFFLLSVYILIASYNLGIGTFQEPKVGMSPFLIGIGLFFCVVIWGLKIFKENEVEVKTKKQDDTNPKHALHMVFIVFVYITCVGLVGFIISSFIFMSVYLWIFAKYSIKRSIIYSIVTTSMMAIVFIYGLSLKLPTGIL